MEKSRLTKSQDGEAGLFRAHLAGVRARVAEDAELARLLILLALAVKKRAPAVCGAERAGEREISGRSARRDLQSEAFFLKWSRKSCTQRSLQRGAGSGQ